MGAKSYCVVSSLMSNTTTIAGEYHCGLRPISDSHFPCTHLLRVFLNRELSVPVTVKIRAQENESDTLELARRLEGAGAQLLTGVTLDLCDTRPVDQFQPPRPSKKTPAWDGDSKTRYPVSTKSLRLLGFNRKRGRKRAVIASYARALCLQCTSGTIQ